MKRNTWYSLLILVLAAAMLLSGCRRRTSQEKRESHRRGGRETVETVPTETLPPETVPWVPSAPTIPRDIPDPSAPTRPREPLIYEASDPNFVSQNPQWEERTFQWESPNGYGTLQFTGYVDAEMFRYYKSQERIWGRENYYKYLLDPNNRKLSAYLIEGIKEATKGKNLNDSAVAREIAAFVQDVIEYEYDDVSTGMEEYPRYPVETVYEKIGDCEDTSFLMASLLYEWGYEVGLLHLPGHLAVAIRTSDTYSGGSYYEYNGHRYLYIESTGSGFKIGEIPKDEMNQQAELFLIP